jgi:hypothetical protein
MRVAGYVRVVGARSAILAALSSVFALAILVSLVRTDLAPAAREAAP